MYSYRARASSEVRLHSLIAEAYLQCGKYRMVRIYVERIYCALYSMDDRANHLKFPLEIPSNSQVAPETYAALLHVAARVSLVHGKDHEAIDELTEASNFDPSDTSITQLMEQVEERWNARRRHRKLQEDHQENRLIKKREGIDFSPLLNVSVGYTDVNHSGAFDLHESHGQRRRSLPQARLHTSTEVLRGSQ